MILSVPRRCDGGGGSAQEEAGGCDAPGRAVHRGAAAEWGASRWGESWAVLTGWALLTHWVVLTTLGSALLIDWECYWYLGDYWVSLTLVLCELYSGDLQEVRVESGGIYQVIPVFTILRTILANG